MIRITYACVSDKGNIRVNNQDNFLCDGRFMEYENDTTQFPLYGQSEKGNMLFGVFDGLGGEEHGEIASYLTAREASQCSVHGVMTDRLVELCRKANRTVCGYVDEHDIVSMGTTAALIAFSDEKITVCNIGDTRIYKCDPEGIRQLSVDHLGFAPRGLKPPLSQCIGIPEDRMILEPYSIYLDYESIGLFLLCSDGLTDVLSDNDIFGVLCSGDIITASEELVRLAKERGGRDNITVLLAGYENL